MPGGGLVARAHREHVALRPNQPWIGWLQHGLQLVAHVGEAGEPGPPLRYL